MKNILFVGIASVFASACIKTAGPQGAATLTIYNAVVGSNSLVANIGGTPPLVYYADAFQAYYANFSTMNQLNSYSGPLNVLFYQYPDTASGKPFFSVGIDLPIGSIHSLLLTGSVQQPDTVFTTDLLPTYASTDSTAGIRFVNLSPGSAPVSVDLKGSANGSEVSSLPYKGVTTFKRYGAGSAAPSYSFEFRDAASGTLIASYTAANVGMGGFSYYPNSWRFKNNTLALVGSPDSVGMYQQQVVLINNF